jgi:hypothetical protein
MSKPHAYTVEILRNPGSGREYWLIDDEAGMFEDVEDARSYRQGMIELGYLDEHTRVVGLVTLED